MRWSSAGLLGFASLFVLCSASAAEPLEEVLQKVASAYGAAPSAIRESGTTFSVLQGEGSLLRLYHSRIASTSRSGTPIRTKTGR